MAFPVLDKEILSAVPLSKLQQMMTQRNIPWKNVMTKKGRKRVKKFGSTKEPFIAAILDHQDAAMKESKKKNKKIDKNKNKKKNQKKKKIYKRDININEPPEHPGLPGSDDDSNGDNVEQIKENNDKNAEESGNDDEWLNGRFQDSIKNDEFDKDGLDSLQDDVNEFAGRKLLSEKHLKLLRNQLLTRQYVESLVQNKDTRLQLDLGVVMAIEGLLQRDKSMGNKNKNDNDTNKNKKDKKIITFDGENLHKLVDYIYHEKYKDIYVVSAKNKCKGGVYVFIGSKTFYGKWENIFLELIFTIKEWLIRRDDESDPKKKKQIKGKDVHGDIIKNLTSYRTRIWHWRAAVVDPTGYTDILTSDMVAGDDGQGKIGFGEIASLLSKKMLVETYLEYEDNLETYPFMYDEQFVKDFQIMTGDIWDSVKDISLIDLNIEAKIAGIGAKKKKKKKKKNEHKRDSD